MPVPTNLTPATAIVLTSLPYTVTLDAFEVPTQSLWFRYDKSSSEYTVLGLASAVPSSTGTYVPRVTIWSGDPDDLDSYLNIIAVAVPFSMPAYGAVTSFYFEVHRNSGVAFTEQLQFDLIAGPANAVPAGSIAINDDTDEFPMAMVSATTGAVLQQFPFPAGETVARLPSGEMLWADRWNKAVGLYSAAFAFVADIAWSLLTDHDDSPVTPLAASATEFYIADVGRFTGTPRNAQVTTVSATGVLGSTVWDLGSYYVWGIGVNAAGTILYYTQASGNTPIQRWDLVSDVALSDLAPAVAGGFITHDILVLSDGSVVMGYKQTVGDDYALHFSAAGTLLHTYTLTSTQTMNRLAYASDSTSFWVWSYLVTPGGYSRFEEIRISDGVVLSTVDSPFMVGGVWQSTVSPGEPLAGHSFSCPFLIVPEPLDEDVAEPGSYSLTGAPVSLVRTGVTYETRTLDQRRLRRASHLSDEHRWLTYDRFQLDLQAGVGLTDGQGEDPQVMVRWSNDGGHTWSREQWRTAGRQGARKTRVIVRQTGRARVRTFEVVVSDPVAWYLAAAYLDVTPGTGN